MDEKNLSDLTPEDIREGLQAIEDVSNDEWRMENGELLFDKEEYDHLYRMIISAVMTEYGEDDLTEEEFVDLTYQTVKWCEKAKLDSMLLESIMEGKFAPYPDRDSDDFRFIAPEHFTYEIPDDVDLT